KYAKPLDTTTHKPRQKTARLSRILPCTAGQVTYGILTIVLHLLKSDSMLFGICAETAIMCLPGLNKSDSLVPEIPLTSPVAPDGTGIEPSLTRFGIPVEMS